MKSLPISQTISFFMPLVWMLRRQGKVVFDIKCEFLLDNLKWFSWDIALEYSSSKRIDIFLCRLIANDFFIVLFCREWRYKRSMIGGRLFDALPFPSLFLHFLFRERIVFISHCFVIAERRERSGEKFSPFSSASHVIDNLSSESLIFSDWIGLIEDTMSMFFERDTSEIIMRVKTRDTVEMIAARPVLDAKTVIRCIDTGIDTFISPFRITSYGRDIHIMPWIAPDVFSIFAILGIMDMETFYAVFPISDVVSYAIFPLENMTKFFRESVK